MGLMRPEEAPIGQGVLAGPGKRAQAAGVASLLRALRGAVAVDADHKAVLARICDALGSYLDAHSLVALCDEGGALVPVASFGGNGVPRDGGAEAHSTARVVLEADEPLVLPAHHSGYPSDTTLDPDLHALVAPGRSGSVRLVLQIQRAVPPFTQEEAEVASAAASLMASSLEAAERFSCLARQAAGKAVLERENARLQATVAQQSERLHASLGHLGEAFAAGADLNETLQAVVDAAVDVMGASSGVLRLLRDGRLEAMAYRGGPEVKALSQRVFNLGEGVAGTVAATGKPVVVNDASALVDEPHIPEAGVRSLVCVPIMSMAAGRCIGTLAVHNRRSGRGFDEEDEAALTAFAGHAAAAVERAALAAEQRDAAMEIAVLHEVATATTSLDLSEVLAVSASKAMDVAGVDHCCIFLRDIAKPELVCAECRGLADGLCRRLMGMRIPLAAVSDDLWQRLEAGETVCLPNEGLLSPVLQRLASLVNVEGACLVPLLAKNSVIGALYLQNSKGPLALDERQHRVLRSVCRQLGVAIDNARLYEQLNRRVRELSALDRVSKAVSSTLDLRELLDLALAETVDVLRADTGSIMLMRDQGDGLRVEVAYGLPDRLLRRSVSLLGEGIAGWVALHGEPLLVGNVASDPRFRLLVDRPEIRSAMSVPLVAGNTMLGVLNVSSSNPARVFTKGDLNLMTTIAGQLAVAIQNAKHYEEERRVAQVARNALLPRLPLRVPGLDVGEKHVPAADVGGDYYDIMDLGDGRVGIVVSDVSGHGVSAAMHAAMGKNFIRALCHHDPSPGKVLKAANALMAKETPSEVFVSLVYGVLDVKSMRFTYANAGHVPPIHVNQSGEARELAGTGMLLGLWPESDYEEVVVSLEPGDVLVCCTDGITEARRGKEQFGYERLKASAVRNRNRSAQEIADRIYRRALAYCGRQVEDDIALLVLKLLT